MPNKENPATEKNLHRLFELSVVIKAFNGVVEIISGILILILSKAALNNLFVQLTRIELFEDPQDKLVHYLHQAFLLLSSSKNFAGLYVLVHGVINIFVVASLYKEKLWAYWVALSCTCLFMIYQLYRFSHTYSAGSAILIIFELFFIMLTWHEYKHHSLKLARR